MDTNKRPYNATGTYVLYNASGLLERRCRSSTARGRSSAGGSRRRPTTTIGTVNCAVEPPKGNAVARQVYGTFC